MKRSTIFANYRIEYLSLVGVLLLQGLCVHYFWGQIGDDSYIFFRYASNLLQHQELNWNVGRSPVEGFSSPLWVFILALSGTIGDIEFSAKILGSTCSCLALFRVWQLSSKNIVSVFGALIGMGFQYWAVSGLETSLYCFLFLSSLLALRGRASVFWIAILGLTRPEAPLLVGISSLLLWRERKFRNAVIICIPTIIYLVFRLWFFGELLPNTYFAKATGDIASQTLRGLDYAVIPILASLFLWRDKIMTRSEQVLPGVLLLIVIGGGGDWMWHERLLVPIYLVLWSWNGLLCGLRRVGMLVVLGSASIPFSHWAGILGGERLSPMYYQEGTLVETSRLVAEDIREKLPVGSTIAINHAGALPYFLPEYVFVDMTGLNDHWIARRKGELHAKFDSQYILDQQPDLIVLNSLSNPQNGFEADYWIGESDLFSHPRFRLEYRLVSKSWQRKRYLGSPAFIVLCIRSKAL